MEKEIIKQSILQAILNDPNKNDIIKVSLFGSHLNGDAKKDSDVDVLVELDPNSNVGFFKLAQIRRNMMKYVGKDIDLVTPSALSEYFKDEVINNAEFVYER